VLAHNSRWIPLLTKLPAIGLDGNFLVSDFGISDRYFALNSPKLPLLGDIINFVEFFSSIRLSMLLSTG